MGQSKGKGKAGQDDEIEDIEAFRAQLDASTAAVRSVVHSWIPDDALARDGWKRSDPKRQKPLSSLARPARLGLGAQPSALHIQRAQEDKMRRQLLGSRARKEEEPERPHANVSAPKHGNDDTDSDEEESRTKSVKRKRVDTVTDLTTSKKKTKKAASPAAIPSVAASAVASTSFYTTAAAASASTNGSASPTALSKNQRKKERQKQKALELAANQRKIDADTPSSPTAAERVASPPRTRKAIKVPFAPPPTSTPEAASAHLNGKVEQGPASDGEGEDNRESDGDDDDDKTETVSSRSASPSKANESLLGGADGKKKKKKKRRKKSKAGAAAGGGVGEGEKAVLNLTPLP